MNQPDPVLIARRLSRPMTVVMSLLTLHFVLWVLAATFNISTWMPVELIFQFLPIPIVVGGIIQIIIIGAIHFLIREIKRFSKVPVIINFSFITLIYLGIFMVVGYWASGLPAWYSGQLDLGAHRGWLLTLLFILGGLAVAFIGFVLRNWLLHAAGTKVLLASSGSRNAF